MPFRAARLLPGSRICTAHNCRTSIPRGLWFCTAHWDRLTAGFRLRIATDTRIGNVHRLRVMLPSARRWLAEREDAA